MDRALRLYLLGIAAPAAVVLVLMLGLPEAPSDPVLAAVLVAIGALAANFPVMIRKNYKVDATPAIASPKIAYRAVPARPFCIRHMVSS